MTDKDLKALGTKLKIDFKKIPFSEFKTGMRVELEHKDVTKGDPVKTAKIALAHIKERPDYYKLLMAKVEGAPKKKVASKRAK